jgi:hypothetical protein
MAFGVARIACSGTEAELTAGIAAGTFFQIKNLGSTTDIVYLGPTGVATTDGYPLHPGETFKVEDPGAAAAASLFGITVAGGAQTVAVIEAV